jgi:nucleoside-diphosphate-sugar epimerase
LRNETYRRACETLREERVLLVGGAGFIGHNLALELRRGGVETMVADNLMVNNIVSNVSRGEIEAVQRHLYRNFLLDRFEAMRDADVHLRNADARAMVDLSQVFDEFKPTKVVHLAAIASAVQARNNPGLAFDLQLVTLRNTLELCRLQHGTVNQTMFLSSSTVYGDFATPEVDETTFPRPRGIYANGKYMGERLVRTYSEQHGVGSVIVRPSALYGERCVNRRVSQVFIENALSGKPLMLEGGGDGRLDFTYIDDLVEGMVRALSCDASGDYTNTFNITFGQARTIRDLAALVCEVVPEAVLEKRPRAEDKPIRGTLSSKRAETILDFKAAWPLEKGYRHYCNWYAEQWRKAKQQSKLD